MVVRAFGMISKVPEKENERTKDQKKNRDYSDHGTVKSVRIHSRVLETRGDFMSLRTEPEKKIKKATKNW